MGWRAGGEDPPWRWVALSPGGCSLGWRKVKCPPQISLPSVVLTLPTNSRVLGFEGLHQGICGEPQVFLLFWATPLGLLVPRVPLLGLSAPWSYSQGPRHCCGPAQSWMHEPGWKTPSQSYACCAGSVYPHQGRSHPLGLCSVTLKKKRLALCFCSALRQRLSQ